MHEIFNILVSHARAMWRYRWAALVLAWVVAIGGWLHVTQMPDVYRSSARVHIDTDSILRPLLRGLAVEANISHRIQLMTRTLLSQPNMEKLARMTDMHLQAETPLALERITDQMRSRISISSEARQGNLFTISYRDEDPRKAQEVVQALLTIFMETTLGESRQDTNSAQRFLDQQISEYERRLAEAEQRRADFRRANVGMLPGDRGSYYQRLQTVEGQIEETQLRIREAENRRAELQKQLERERPTVDGPGSVWDSPLRVDARIDSLQEQLDNLLLRFTENHPDVVALRKTIADLQAQREEELALRAEAMEGFEGAAASGSPLYQQIRLSISDTDAEIATLKVRLAEFQRQGARLREAVDTIPQIEAEMQRLDRDYDVNRRQYDELLKRRETAEISQLAEDRGEHVQFRIIDPARLPSGPDGPDRPMFYSMSLLAGLGVGLGIAFLLAQLRPVFDSRKSLADLGYPVLGTVSWILTPVQRARARVEHAGFASSLLVLVVAYVGMIVAGDHVRSFLTQLI